MKPLESYESNGVNLFLATGSTLEELREAPYVLREGGPVVASPGSLIPLGGAADDELDVVAAAVGDANLVIVTTPTGDEKSSFDTYEARFRELGVIGNISQISRKTDRDKGEAIIGDKKTKVVFTVGGNQLTAVESLDNANLLAAFRHSRKRGVIHAGTSAGASYMGAEMPMSLGNDDSSHDFLYHGKVNFVRGGGLTNLVIDQHVRQRNRMDRVLAGAVWTRRSAVGLDEATGAEIPLNGGNIRTFGKGETHLSYRVNGDTKLVSVPPDVIVDFSLTHKLRDFPITT